MSAKAPTCRHGSKDIAEYSFQGDRIPEHMVDGLSLYILEGVVPGGFLTAVLRNDLMMAAGTADDKNIRVLHVYCAYLYNEAPTACYGSPEKVKAWRDQGGLKGSKK